ncbi:superoxide dismutase family protein [Hyphomicrobium sp. CS1BSMeth3]|uniref:superoxide dismutase family protein n=1 Tax=Hyphomicrobium sp. CS1BSMeth3 TaxID=1892844 RepID=UPI0009318FDA|nr:superoxide dismutase family protein [Hyphomicrobium sp. CS1BSMeth3]
MKPFLACAAAIALVATAAVAQESKTATATFISKAGKESGTAKLTGTDKGVLIEIDVSGLPPSQWVAFHVHETGSCEHAGGHMSAGGHFNPTKASHGFNDPKGPHAGDMPNQYVGADGTLRAQVFNTFVRLDGGDNAIRGRALMIHGKADDYKSQPAGDAGDRQACGVIK